MPKAVISNRIYLDVTPEIAEHLRRKLTYKIAKKPRPGLTRFNSFDIVKNYKDLGKNIFSIPCGRSDLIPDGYEIVDKRILHELPFPNPKWELRPGQQAVYDVVDDMCFINAKVGWGKTFTALHIAKKLGQKTLVVTHTTMLRDQWIQQASNLFNMPIGKIGSEEFDIDHSLVIGNIQTLTKITDKINKEFGTVIVDEAHHCPATTFTSFIDGMYARYKIGLSGTMNRTDGKHVLFRDFFGNDLHQPVAEGTMVPQVQLVPTGIMLSPGEVWARKINNLLYDEDYQRFVAITAMMQMEKGHKVLIIADRVEFLKRMEELIGESCVCITGGTDFEERKELVRLVETGEKTCVAGSRQIFSEGISVDILSCVILATPISNPSLLEQIIGRIQRTHDDKLTPLVIDMQFSGAAEKKQNNLRTAFYVRQGWEVLGLKN